MWRHTLRRLQRQILRRENIWPLTILVLMTIGILTMFTALLVPLVMVGIVVFLYFFPPYKWRYWLARFRQRSSRSSYSRTYGDAHRARRTNRTVKLRVIKGNKSDDKDEPPRYH